MFEFLSNARESLVMAPQFAVCRTVQLQTLFRLLLSSFSPIDEIVFDPALINSYISSMCAEINSIKPASAKHQLQVSPAKTLERVAVVNPTYQAVTFGMELGESIMQAVMRSRKVLA